MSKKTTVKPPEKAATQAALVVTSRQGRRFRAGFEFGPVPRTVEVTPERAALIEADAFLSVER
ncbi:hypothetical protein [Geoalkalibacter halelectricus]|uniref:hypothetical protein n=1 Tax=Geoalkalibacter halelectricus TaxID=2847045 RepID=UPI003D1C8E2A